MNNKAEQKVKDRARVMELVKEGKITLKDASAQLGISYRQGKRVYSDYVEGGEAALEHGNKGREPVNKTEKELVEKAMELFGEKYDDFAPTFAAEKLEELDGIALSVSVLRRAMIANDLWVPAENTFEHRSRREAKEHFGELVQFDGSHHKWFEERGPRCCLITLIDDARKIRLSQFFDEETMFGAMKVLKMWIKRYGIPQALYCDRKNAFVLTREATDSELLEGITKPKSHFGRACEKLGIEVIAAYSAQAKGRVERNHGIDQDRLVKELRLAGISTIPEANRFLLNYYLPKMNRKFSRTSRNPDDFHRPLGKIKLNDVLCIEEERTVAKDFVVRYTARLFQILKNSKVLPRPGDKVTVRLWMDESIHVYWKGEPVRIKEIPTMFD
ncbi:MAG: ISNCY family transposase [Spirochaetaceae bacterium]|jgi:transposase|nr:ISNCY family transposase [Spirochaetaceae bacterium]